MPHDNEIVYDWEPPPHWLSEGERQLYEHGVLLREEAWASHDLISARREKIARSLDLFFEELAKR